MRHKAPAQFVLYRGGGVGPVRFDALPGLEFRPGQPVVVSERQASAAAEIAVLLACDEAGQVFTTPGGDVAPQGGIWGLLEDAGYRIVRQVVVAAGETLPEQDNRRWALLSSRL